MDSGDLLTRFLEYAHEKGLELYPAQEEALLELYEGKNLILNTPTGSGKSLVASALHFHSLARGRRSVYTCPIKALVNEKFLTLCREFGPENVGMVTGDGSVNPGAPILCCTAEILSNDALRLGAEAPVDDVIMDEFHYYSDRDRGVAWQIPLLILSKARFLLMSATLGDTDFFEKELTRLTGLPTSVVRSDQRPVPLEFEYSESPLHETVERLLRNGRAPVYLVNFTQRQCAEEAQNFLSIDFCSKEEKRAIADELRGVKFSSPYGKEIQKLLKHGIGLHHAGLLPRYRILVEKLAQKGMLKLICGTDTLGVGVNVPIRTVVFTQLCKYDGDRTSILSVRDFQQIAGRAGRKGYDSQGWVIAQAPAHVVENLRMEQKSAGDPKKLKKIVKRKPPEKGYVAWNRDTFEKLVKSPPEALQSRFRVTHGMLLQVLGREGEDGCRAMRKLIRDCHEAPVRKKSLRKEAFQLFRSLVERKIIELNPLRLHVDLQEDFSLNHALALYLIDTLKLLDREDPDYALDVLTLVESIAENPDLILRRQLDRIKSEKMNEMKAAGVEYDERIEELEKLEYPKPRREFIYQTFNAFAESHPWVGGENIRPKSIAREMVEQLHTFGEYVREYGLERVEGLLMRYLSEVYKALVQSVPLAARNEELEAIIVYLRNMIRQVDSSLLDEWERLRDPGRQRLLEESEQEPGGELDGGDDVTRNAKAFGILVRNESFRFVRALARRDYEGALELLQREEAIASTGSERDRSGSGEFEADEWTADRVRLLMEEHEREHGALALTQDARSARHLSIVDDDFPRFKKVQQILVDSEGHNDWVVEFALDLELSRLSGAPALRLIRIGPLAG